MIRAIPVPRPVVLPLRSAPTPPLTEIEFCAWVAQALPGNRLEYHRGFLACDTCAALSCLEDGARRELRRLGARALWTAEHRLVHLVQARIEPGVYAYLAVARSKPRTTPASLSTIIAMQEAA